MSVWARVLVLPRPRSAAQEIFWATLGAVALALLAQVRIPLTPVPITLQVLGVLLLAGWLGPYAGTLAVLEYLALGTCGLPVFTQGLAGAPWMLITGGFLFAFGPAAFLYGVLTQRVTGLSYPVRLAALFAGGLLAVGIIYLGGVFLRHVAPEGQRVVFAAQVHQGVAVEVALGGGQAQLHRLRQPRHRLGVVARVEVVQPDLEVRLGVLRVFRDHARAGVRRRVGVPAAPLQQRGVEVAL